MADVQAALDRTTMQTVNDCIEIIEAAGGMKRAKSIALAVQVVEAKGGFAKAKAMLATANNTKSKKKSARSA